VPTRRKQPKKTKTTLALAKVLRVHRHALGLSQEAFAERVDLSKNCIGNLERGEYEPSVSTLAKAAKQFNLKASDLLREAGY
jgi:DNA-binding XRE family transcriptional regulator